jgi:hypothetical protein
MSSDRYELMERQIREILLEDSPASVPERLRRLISDVPDSAMQGTPGLFQSLTRLRRAGVLLVAVVAMVALVALVAMPLLLHPAGGMPAGAPGVYPSILPGYPTDDPTSQLVATGHVVDSEGQPVAGVVLYVDLFLSPPQSTQCLAAPCQLVTLDAVVSATDGSFSVHLKPNAAILAAAKANGGFADLTCGPRISGFQFTMGDFSLQVEGDHFTALPGPITIVIDTLHPHPPVTVPPYPVPSPAEASVRPT